MNSLQFNYISRLYSLIHINASNNIMVDNHVNINHDNHVNSFWSL